MPGSRYAPCTTHASAPVDELQEFERAADNRTFGTSDPKLRAAIRHGYLLALEDLRKRGGIS